MSIFDNIATDDVILAFFPCTMFQEVNDMIFRGIHNTIRKKTTIEILETCIQRHETLHEFYVLVCKLFVIILKKNLKMVVENPYTQPHYLTRYFPIEPTVIDGNRWENGDYFKKPTQYWFVGFKPQDNIVFEPIDHVDIQNIERQRKKGDISSQTLRSMIHPQYASRFIRQYIIPKEGKIWTNKQNESMSTC